MVFVNKMDRTGADFLKVHGQIADRLKANVALIQFFIGAEGEPAVPSTLLRTRSHLQG